MWTDGKTPWTLRKPIPLDEELVQSSNIVDLMDEEDVADLGLMCAEDFERDRGSRLEWEQRVEECMKLALQVTEPKTFPWEGAANVKFPLLTIAAVQYQSRAYPALVNGPRPISCEPFAKRPDIRIPQALAQAVQAAQQAAQKPGTKPDPKAQQALQQMQKLQQTATQQIDEYNQLADRCDRISRHMSYQILEEDTDWEENQDKALLVQCLLGCVFKKVYFDPVKGHNISECVNPRDLVVSYYTKSIETAQRLTHVIYLTSNDCYERQARGLFADFKEGSPRPEPRLMYEFGVEASLRQGITQPASDHDAPYEILEQLRWLDLDDDGYAEPYIVTLRYDTRQVLRIAPRFTRGDITFTSEGKVIRINPIQCFVKYPFIPSPDGGFYDLGLGALLGPVNRTIDTVINQMLDAGTLGCAGGGFLGRGFRNKKGEYRFRLGEWHTVDSSGDDLRKNIVPLPTPTLNPALFQLLSLLIEYGEGISGATDILQGKNPGQNTPAETSRAMVEQGMKVFNGVYKRTHRAFTQEVRLLLRLNTIFITDDMPFYPGQKTSASQGMADAYKDARVTVKAAADPFYMSDAQRYNQATSLLAAAHSSPGYDLYEVNKYYLESLKLPMVDKFLPNPKGPYAVPPPPNPKLQIEQLKQQSAQMKVQIDFKVKVLELVQKAEMNAAQIEELKARAAFELAQAKGVKEGHVIAMIEAQIGAAKAKQEGLLEAIKLMHSISSTSEVENGGSNESAGVGGMASASGNSSVPGLPGPQAQPTSP